MGEFNDWEEAWQATIEGAEQPKPWILETYYGDQSWQTLADTGNSIYMAKSSLPASLSVVWTTTACFHGHVEACPIVQITLCYLG